MESKIWFDKWETGDIGFHESDGSRILKAYWGELNLPAGSRVFLPLCGKTRDIAWLLSKGCRVVGVELVPLAVDELFAELGIAPKIEEAGELLRYAADGIDVFVGDVFALSAEQLGEVDLIFDRAALVALDEETRRRYAKRLQDLSRRAPQLVVTFEYDQSLRPGPPFSVSEAEVREAYGAGYQLRVLQREAIPQSLAKGVQASEVAWLMQPSS